MLIPLLLLAVAAGSYAFLPSSWRKLRHRLGRKKRQQEGVLYLTFDDGPSPQDTAALSSSGGCRQRAIRSASTPPTTTAPT